MDIQEVLIQEKELERKKKELDEEIQHNKDMLNSFYLFCHKKLLQTSFYDIFLESHNKKISELFSLREGNLPYTYMGEGDFKDIVFKTDGRKLKLLYHYTWNFGVYIFLDEIPLELFEEGNETELSNHANETVLRHKKKIEEKKRTKLLKEQEDLNKRLKEIMDENEIYIKNMREWIPKIIGMRRNKAIDAVNDDGFNCAIYKEDGKVFNEIGSCGTKCIYLEIENKIIIGAY